MENTDGLSVQVGIFGLCAKSSSSRIQTFQIFASPQNPTTFLKGGRILITNKEIIQSLPKLLSFKIFTVVGTIGMKFHIERYMCNHS
jgi:hypothetical protein